MVTDNGDSVPITLEFEDTTGDGKLDMIVHIGDQKIVYLNDGTQFKPQQWVWDINVPKQRGHM